MTLQPFLLNAQTAELQCLLAKSVLVLKQNATGVKHQAVWVLKFIEPKFLLNKISQRLVGWTLAYEIKAGTTLMFLLFLDL